MPLVLFCAILIIFLHCGKEICMGFASLKGLKNGWWFSAFCDVFLLTIHQQNQGWILTQELYISSLIWKSAWGRTVLVISNSTWSWGELNWGTVFLFPLQHYCGDFQLLLFLSVQQCSSHTPTPLSGPQLAAWLSLSKMEHDTSALTFFMLSCGVLCCWFSPAASDVLSMSSQYLIYWCCTPTGAQVELGP